MKYYLHDANAFNDEKITELYINFGYEGLGLFYTILEKLAQQEKPIKTIVLKKQLHVGKKLEKCWVFMESLELISSNNSETFNKQLMNFSGKYAIKKEKNRKRISEWREKQEVIENVTCNKTVRNNDKVNKSKVNKSKVNKIEENIESENVFNFQKSLINFGIEKTLVSEWLVIRKNKKLTNTQTSFNAIQREISKSNKTPNECIKIAVEKSWGGFEAAWLQNIKTNNNNKTGITNLTGDEVYEQF